MTGRAMGRKQAAASPSDVVLELRMAIREANGIMKSLRQEVKEARAAIEQMKHVVRETTAEVVMAELDKQMATTSVYLEGVMKKSVSDIMDEFDRIGAMIMNRSAENKSRSITLTEAAVYVSAGGTVDRTSKVAGYQTDIALERRQR